MKRNINKNALKILVVAFVMGTLFGCGGGVGYKPVQLYPGPELPRQQIVQLQACPPIVVEKVDGVMNEGQRFYPYRFFYNESLHGDLYRHDNARFLAHLLPGSHTIVVGYYIKIDRFMTTGEIYTEWAEGNKTLTFEAKAGEHYWILPGKKDAPDGKAIWKPFVLRMGDINENFSGTIMNCSNTHFINLSETDISK